MQPRAWRIVNWASGARVAPGTHILDRFNFDKVALAEPAPLVGKLAQFLAKRTIIVPFGTVMHALAIDIDDTARPPYSAFLLEIVASDRP